MAKILKVIFVLFLVALFTSVVFGKTGKIPVSGVKPMMMKADPGYLEKSSAKDGQYVPPPDTSLVVVEDVDYGGSFSSPLNYSPQRHTMYHKYNDTYYVVWEWGDKENNAVSISNWEEIGGFGFWNMYEHFNVDFCNDPATNGGRPSVLGSETDSKVMVAWHQDPGSGVYDLYFGYKDDFNDWVNISVSDTSDADTETFPCLAKDSNGNLWITSDYASGSVHDMRVFESTDGGLTWLPPVAPNPFTVIDTWSMPVIEGDPTNGDVWLAYHDTIGTSVNLDMVVHHYDALTKTWGDRQIIDTGATGSQCALATIAVDSKHNLHLVYQRNMAENGTSGGLNGFSHLGPAGPLWYITGTDGDWSTPVPITGTEDTDSITGPPSLGIDNYDNLYVAFTQIDSAESAGGGSFTMFNTFNTYISRKQAKGDWEDRWDCSKLGYMSFADSFHTMWAHVTPRVWSDPSEQKDGPGVAWAQMKNATPPADVLFSRPYSVGVKDQGKGTPALPKNFRLAEPVPNPMNPMTTIGYSIAEKAHVALTLYTTMGQKVKTLVNKTSDPGEYSVMWNGTNENGDKIVSGVYFCKLNAGNYTETKKIIVLK